jgi:hypothetical protein
MPTRIKSLYSSRGTTIKTTVHRDANPAPPPPKPPERPPLVTVDPNSGPSDNLDSDYPFDSNVWDMEDEDGNELFDSDDPHNPRRLHQVWLCNILHYGLL